MFQICFMFDQPDTPLQGEAYVLLSNRLKPDERPFR